MTFKDSEIAAIGIDMNTLWLYDEERERVVVDFYPGYPMRNKVLGFLDLDNEIDVYDNGYIVVNINNIKCR